MFSQMLVCSLKNFLQIEALEVSYEQMKRSLLLGSPGQCHITPCAITIQISHLTSWPWFFQSIGAFLPFIQNYSSGFSLLSCCRHSSPAELWFWMLGVRGHPQLQQLLWRCFGEISECTWEGLPWQSCGHSPLLQPFLPKFSLLWAK